MWQMTFKPESLIKNNFLKNVACWAFRQIGGEVNKRAVIKTLIGALISDITFTLPGQDHSTIIRVLRVNIFHLMVR